MARHMTAKVQLPPIYCVDCRTQVVNYPFVEKRSNKLVCVFCARKREDAGRGHTVIPLTDDAGGYLRRPQPALDPLDAAALLIRLGGKLID